MKRIRPVSTTARPGTHWIGPRGEIAIVTHLMDDLGCDVELERATVAIIWTAQGYDSLALSRRERANIHQAAGSA
jgi:hypothetical protein